MSILSNPCSSVSLRFVCSMLMAVVTHSISSGSAMAETFVPGTGEKIEQVGDDFESDDWRYSWHGRKASYEQDEQQRPPGGRSKNGRWYESAMRGHPDVIKRISTPPGGLESSQGSLLLATRLSGIPGRLSDEQQQDDLLMGVKGRIGRPIPVGWSPSFVVRVYLPPFDQWENRTGASFGIRGDVRGRDRHGEIEPYWPGMFILFRSETSRRFDEDFAQISVRAQKNGRDLGGPKIYEPGWWTFGMSYTPNGMVHSYASEGVDDLTAEDHLYSSFPYGSRCMYFDNFFVNVANWDNGKSWSTPWVIDDPEVFVIPPKGQTLANLIRHRGRQVARKSSPKSKRPSSGKRTYQTAKRRSTTKRR